MPSSSPSSSSPSLSCVTHAIGDEVYLRQDNIRLNTLKAVAVPGALPITGRDANAILIRPAE